MTKKSFPAKTGIKITLNSPATVCILIDYFVDANVILL